MPKTIGNYKYLESDRNNPGGKEATNEKTINSLMLNVIDILFGGERS